MKPSCLFSTNRILPLLICALLLILLPATHQSAYGQGATPSQGFTATQGLTVPAIHQEDGLYLPLRAVAEGMGYQVTWSQKDRTAAVTTPDGTISVDLVNSRVNAYGHEYYSNSPLMKQDRMYLHAQFFAEEFHLRAEQGPDGNAAVLFPMMENAMQIKTIQEASSSKALEINLQYPQIQGLSNQAVQDQLNQLFQSLAAQAKKTGEQNAADLAPVLIQYPEMQGPSARVQTWFDYRIKYNQNDLLSLVFLEYQFAGGAHGSTIQSGYTFDLTTGKQISLADQFLPGVDYVSVISKEVKRQIDERGLTDALFEPFSKIRPDQGYSLTNQGLVVFFQQYEIMPYAAGIQEFTIAYQDLQGMLKNQALGTDQGVIRVKAGETFSVSLKGNPTTGYQWHYAIEDPTVVRLISETSVSDSTLIGAGSTYIWDFQGLAPGISKLTFKYYRSWEGEASTTPENTVVYQAIID